MLVLSHISAFEFWRSETSAGASLAKMRMDGPASIPPSEVRDVVSSGMAGREGVLSLPFHVLMENENQNHEASGIQFHRAGSLEEGDRVYRAGSGLFVSSPELCFLQLSSVLSLESLILAGCELCAAFRYPMDRSGDLPKCEPVTNPPKMARFLERHQGAYGLNKAKRALRYIHSDTASPAEAALAVFLCNSYSLGGYGLPAPCINRKIRISGAAKNITKRAHFVADLYWPHAKLDVEYDGRMHHASHRGRSNDAERSNALGLMGIEVVSVTRDQLFSRAGTHGLATSLSKRLKKRIRPKAGFVDAQVRLRTKLVHYVRTGKFDEPGLYGTDEHGPAFWA